MGAVGPTQFIIALNGRVRSFSKATGQADGGRAGMTEVVRNNRATAERAGLAIIAFVVVSLVVGLEIAILAAALVAGLELLLGAIGSKPD